MGYLCMWQFKLRSIIAIAIADSIVIAIAISIPLSLACPTASYQYQLSGNWKLVLGNPNQLSAISESPLIASQVEL